MSIDALGIFAYCADYDGNLAKINLQTFQPVSILNLDPAGGYTAGPGVDPLGNYAYFSSTNIKKIDLQTFTVTGTYYLTITLA